MSDPTANRGLYDKYHLTHADGAPVDPEGVYFVLKLNAKDKVMARAACKAARCFALHVIAGNPTLGAELDKLARKHLKAAEENPPSAVDFAAK